VLSLVIPMSGDQPVASVVDVAERVVIHGAGQSFASAVNDGIARASGDHIAVISAGDSIDASVVAAIEAAFAAGADVVYTDEARDGVVLAKPAFSPERLRSQFYLGSLTAYRRSLLESIGGVREGIPGAELYDLALRATRSATAVSHLPGVLAQVTPSPLAAEWTPSPAEVARSTRTVLERHLAATGGGTVTAVGEDGVHATVRPVIGSPLVSIVIPTRGTTTLVRGKERCMVVEAVRGIVELSTYQNLEFVVVVDSVTEAGVRRQLAQIGGARLRFVEWSAPFSFSGKMNLGVLHAAGEFVLLLNDDVELISPGWIEPMLALAQRPQAGMVGTMLYFDDDTIQHAGHTYDFPHFTHIGMHAPRGSGGPNSGFLVEREVDGVTAASALIAKAAFLEVGGFSNLLPGNFNDVDLCMKLNARGYQNYWTPRAELYHFESRSRNPRVGKSELETLWRRWRSATTNGPFWASDSNEEGAS
jgi:GT2 family glycosyltransferase